MNTTITHTNNLIEFYGIEVFNASIIAFKEKANKTGLTADEHILYNIVRGLPKKRGFSPIINKVKLANGLYHDYGYTCAKSTLSFNISYKFAALAAMFKLPLGYEKYLLEIIKE